jgi:hypothetical protein
MVRHADNPHGRCSFEDAVPDALPAIAAGLGFSLRE